MGSSARDVLTGLSYESNQGVNGWRLPRHASLGSRRMLPKHVTDAVGARDGYAFPLIGLARQKNSSDFGVFFHRTGASLSGHVRP